MKKLTPLYAGVRGEEANARAWQGTGQRGERWGDPTFKHTQRALGLELRGWEGPGPSWALQFGSSSE